MIDLRLFLETFINDGDIIDIILAIIVFFLFSCLAKALGFGLFKN